ncbi:MAG: hybrid sensor histidine kinase/response regulator, partial [Sphingobacteriales bacterium]
DLRSQPWKLIPYNPRGALHSFVWRNTIHRDSSGVVWMGTTNGLQGINPANDHVFTYQSDPNRYKGLSSNSIQVVYHDRSGMIWVGTDNGIDRQAVNSTPFSIYQIKSNERRASVPENRADAVFKDSRGQLWFNNTPRLYRLSADQKRLDPIPPESLGAVGDHYNEVRSFLPDGKDGVWLGSYDGLYHFDQASGKFTGYPSEMPTQFIAVQKNDHKPRGDIWIGGDGGFASFNVLTHRYTYYRYQPGKPGGIPDRFVYGLLVSQAGEVWIIIHRLGLCRLNPKTGQITRYSAGPKGHLSSNDVRTLYEDQDGIIWIGTYLGGLNRFDPKTGLFTAITHQDGIPGTTIVGITGDASGHLWLSTNDGLCRVN